MNLRRNLGSAVMLLGLGAVALGATEGLRILREDAATGPVAAVGASDDPTASADPDEPAPEAGSETPTTPAVESPAPVHVDGGTRRFVDTFVSWLRAGDGESLLAALHPVVLVRYGEATCGTYTDGLAVDERFTIEVDTVTSVPRWDYATDGLSTRVTDVVRVNGRRVMDGQVVDDEFHFAVVDGNYRWFTDCGTPG